MQSASESSIQRYRAQLEQCHKLGIRIFIVLTVKRDVDVLRQTVLPLLAHHLPRVESLSIGIHAAARDALHEALRGPAPALKEFGVVYTATARRSLTVPEMLLSPSTVSIKALLLPGGMRLPAPSPSNCFHLVRDLHLQFRRVGQVFAHRDLLQHFPNVDTLKLEALAPVVVNDALFMPPSCRYLQLTLPFTRQMEQFLQRTSSMGSIHQVQVRNSITADHVHAALRSLPGLRASVFLERSHLVFQYESLTDGMIRSFAQDRASLVASITPELYDDSFVIRVTSLQIATEVVADVTLHLQQLRCCNSLELIVPVDGISASPPPSPSLLLPNVTSVQVRTVALDMQISAKALSTYLDSTLKNWSCMTIQLPQCSTVNDTMRSPTNLLLQAQRRPT